MATQNPAPGPTATPSVNLFQERVQELEALQNLQNKSLQAEKQKLDNRVAAQKAATENEQMLPFLIESGGIDDYFNKATAPPPVSAEEVNQLMLQNMLKQNARLTEQTMASEPSFIEKILGVTKLGRLLGAAGVIDTQAGFERNKAMLRQHTLGGFQATQGFGGTGQIPDLLKRRLDFQDFVRRERYKAKQAEEARPQRTVQNILDKVAEAQALQKGAPTPTQQRLTGARLEASRQYATAIKPVADDYEPIRESIRKSVQKLEGAKPTDAQILELANQILNKLPDKAELATKLNVLTVLDNELSTAYDAAHAKARVLESNSDPVGVTHSDMLVAGAINAVRRGLKGGNLNPPTVDDRRSAIAGRDIPNDVATRWIQGQPTIRDRITINAKVEGGIDGLEGEAIKSQNRREADAEKNIIRDTVSMYLIDKLGISDTPTNRSVLKNYLAMTSKELTYMELLTGIRDESKYISSLAVKLSGGDPAKMARIKKTLVGLYTEARRTKNPSGFFTNLAESVTK